MWPCYPVNAGFCPSFGELLRRLTGRVTTTVTLPSSLQARRGKRPPLQRMKPTSTPLTLRRPSWHLPTPSALALLSTSPSSITKFSTHRTAPAISLSRHLMMLLRSLTPWVRSRTKIVPSSCSCCVTIWPSGPLTCKMVRFSTSTLLNWFHYCGVVFGWKTKIGITAAWKSIWQIGQSLLSYRRFRNGQARGGHQGWRDWGGQVKEKMYTSHDHSALRNIKPTHLKKEFEFFK